MTHSELMKAVAQKIDIKPNEAAILWEQTSQILMQQLAAQDKIRIKNFGAFVVVKHKSRTVPDPREMSKKLVIFDVDLPKFRPSEQLRALVKDVNPKEMINEEVEVSATPPATSPVTEPSTPVAAAPAAVEGPIATPVDAAPVTPEPEQPKVEQSAADKEIGELTKPINIAYADIAELTIDKSILELIPFHIAKKYQSVPIEKKEDQLVVAMTDPGDREAIELLTRQTGLTIEPRITTLSELQHVLDQYPNTENFNEEEAEGETDTESIKDEATESDAPAAKIVTSLLERAVRDKASDVHIEPEEKQVAVRFRIDGILQQVNVVPKKMQTSVTARLKILSNLKIDESRLPQDGRLRLMVDNRPVDFRLSTLPTVNGEKIVMRILDKSGGIVSFEDLGLRDMNLDRVNDNISKAHGMILVTGPTGSGKTTTLYSVLGRIMSPEVNIVTLEDPVEYRIPGINQSQVNSNIGYDFGSGLRTIVRQDPDVILIGEIRDLETATMAIQSALTGHVVLSTLHTNDSAGAIPRLIDMGIEPFLITSSTNAVVAQRLVRKLCEHCKEPVQLPEESLTDTRATLDLLPDNLKPKDKQLTFYKGKGCTQCHKSGYSGRMGIFEVLSVTEEIKQLALKRVSSSELFAEAVKQGMITLKQDGILKALKGETSLEEVWRVTKD